MKDRFEVIREWSNYSIEQEDANIEKPKGEIYHCFIRLYQTKYKSILSVGGAVKELNGLITRPAKNGLKYTHAAMNYKLNDNFIGLNIGGDNFNNIVVENIRTMDRDKPFQDKENSRFDMFYLKLSKDEYLHLKKSLENTKVDSRFKYDYLRLLIISGDQLVKRIKNFFFSKEDTEEVTKQSNAKDIMLVCSTFVPYILSNVSKRFENWFKRTKTSIDSYTPNEITYLPDITYMYGGYWREYHSKTREYLEEHPEFDKYMK